MEGQNRARIGAYRIVHTLYWAIPDIRGTPKEDKRIVS